MAAVPKAGLEGFVVTSSKICAIDGERGKIQYRGVDIGALAKHSTYEETTYLLWFGELPTRDQLDAFRARMVAERILDEGLCDTLTSLPGTPQPMDALRTVVSAHVHAEGGAIGAEDPAAGLASGKEASQCLSGLVAGFAYHLLCTQVDAACEDGGGV